MSSDTPNPNPADTVGPSVPTRRPYEAPALRSFGTVEDLTHAQSGTGADGGSPGYSAS